MTLGKTLVFCVMLFGLVGCTAPSPVFERVALVDAARAGVIFVYRPSTFVNAVGYPYVYVTGHERVPLKNGGYVSFVVPAGEVEVLVKGQWPLWGLSDKKIRVTVEPRKEYYVRFSSSITGFVTPVYVGKSLNLGLVDPGIGKDEISKTTLSENE